MEENINWQPENLEDSIVKLVPLTPFDFDKIFKVAADPLIWEQHPAKDRYKREVFQLYFDEAISSGSAFLIADKFSGNIIGATRYYNYNPGNSSIAIGYTFLSRKYWGGLYNKSSKTLLLKYAFQFVDKVYFHIGANNLRSQLAIMKIGAIKINEAEIEHYGQKQLHYEYLVQKQEWEK